MLRMLRMLLALVSGSVVACALLFLMQALIASGQSAVSETRDTRIVDFVRVEREERLERKRSKPRRPPNPDAPPPEAPQPSLENNADATGEGLQTGVSLDSGPVEIADVDVNVTAGFGIGAGTADGDYLPIVKVAPVYPNRALTQGVEGYAVVEFTVTRTGAVKDPRVVEYHPSTIFNRAAIAAALKFKYKPRIVDGEPIEVKGVLNKITFQLVD